MDFQRSLYILCAMNKKLLLSPNTFKKSHILREINKKRGTRGSYIAFLTMKKRNFAIQLQKMTLK